ncbi:MAG: ABC transporter [Verrucomicrobia bacterium]|nr:ABC transporter [Verrucomicrobiota bacterium]
MNDEIVQIRNVSKTYSLGGETVHALRDVSLDVGRGQYVSIMGPSGSGKSTLFNIVGGLDTPSAGEVAVDGHRLSEFSQLQLAWFRCHKIGFIFQSFNLVPTMSALENVTIARVFAGCSPDAAVHDASEVLKQVGLGHRLDYLPSELSGGQQQRVAIARALVNKPAIILADEPTGNLDLHTGEEIIDLIGSMKDRFGATVITATHDMKMLKASDMVVWLESGSIARKALKDELRIEVGGVTG